MIYIYINCWKSPHACHPKQARHLPFNSDWVSICLLFHIFAQMFSRTFRSSACWIKAASLHQKAMEKHRVRLCPWADAQATWQSKSTLGWTSDAHRTREEWEPLLHRGPWDWSGVWLLLKSPPPNNNTRPIWYVWSLCLVMSGYNKIKQIGT